MQNQKQIKKVAARLQKNKTVQALCLFVSTLRSIATILAPAGVGAYLLLQYNDLIVIGIAVALLLYGLVRLVNIAYVAECYSAGRK